MRRLCIKLPLPALAITLLSAVYSFHASAQPKNNGPQINFSSLSYKQVLAAARKSHKKVFIDAYADWCSPCKELRKTTFKDAKAAAYFNKNYVNLSLNVEKGEGIALAKTWQIEGLPTLLIVDDNGKVLASHTGFVDGNGLLEFSKEAASK